MADLLNDIRKFLTTSASINSELSASPCYVSHEPDEPDNCITIYPYGGPPPEFGSKRKHNANVQVRVRADTRDRSRSTAQLIINELHENDRCLASTNGIAHAIQSQPIYLMRDDQKRVIHVVSFNFKYVRY